MYKIDNSQWSRNRRAGARGASETEAKDIKTLWGRGDLGLKHMQPGQRLTKGGGGLFTLFYCTSSLLSLYTPKVKIQPELVTHDLDRSLRANRIILLS